MSDEAVTGSEFSDDYTLKPAYVGSGTILLVEDEPRVRGAVAGILEHLGYDVIQAGNGEEALRLLADTSTEDIDLLLTDVIMPIMSGTQLASQLQFARPDIKILFMSGYTDVSTRQHMDDTGANFIRKPFTPTELGEKLQYVLNR